MRPSPSCLLAFALLWVGAANAEAQAQATKELAPPPSSPAAREFVEQVNRDLERLMVRQATAEWIKNTYITDDTERNAATLNAELLGYLNRVTAEAARFSQQPKLDPQTARMLKLIKLGQDLPSPNDPVKREELASLIAKLEGMYGKAKACGPGGKPPCRDLLQLEDVMAKSRDPQELLEAWKGWHDAAAPMKPLYARMVTLANEGARELGFQNIAELWQAKYELEPAELRAEVDRLWGQVEPFYKQLHCYVRSRLTKHYGAQRVPPNGLIPADLLGNMWAQEWSEIYPLVAPFSKQASLDVTRNLKAKGYNPIKMAKLAESFFTSLGLDPLPETFYERSLFTKPKDREVVCHASAWDVTYDRDLRIKACIKVNEQDLVTLHHELGHLYYYNAYYKLPILYQSGANDGFHEAIGDAIALSITPGHLKKIGLLGTVSESHEALINHQLKTALDLVAFLPFGRLVDQWRWDVFSGKVGPDHYNGAWWDLRRTYQGVAPPVPRTEADFDPGAKYHVPGNTPYLRYFLARMLQFQFHRGMCRAAGQTGPLHTCSIYGSKAAGQKLQAMLALGASRPWPDALEVLTGERQIDAQALLEYFAPLRQWLQEATKGETCGW